MNTAQKRVWITFAVSVATISVAAVIIAFVYINNIDVLNPTTFRFKLLNIISMLPLILLVIVSWRFPQKDFDERDKQIDHRAAAWGGIGALITLGGAALFLLFTSRAGPIKSLQIPSIAYLVCFVYFLVSSVVALIQYGREPKGEK